MSRRAKRETETADFARFAKRILRAWSFRVADGDPDDLADMLAALRDMDELVGNAVRANRALHGRSWADVAAAAGISRQAAQQRWGRDAAGVVAAQPAAAEQPAQRTA